MKSNASQSTLTRCVRQMTRAAWNGYMAGKYAQMRDTLIREARGANDSDVRRFRAHIARGYHHEYLRHARAAGAN
jgi:hypothetical protein